MRTTILVLAALAVALALAGCAAPDPKIDVRTVNIAVPVPCREPVPDRPAMPTDALPKRPTLDAFVQAATAEIELREGYEGQLRTALVACTKPIEPRPGGFGLKAR